MLDQKQLTKYSKIANTNQTIVMREYLQLLFLSNFYKNNASKKVYFKGGTAIRLLFNGERFSEDLDFTVNLSAKSFTELFKKIKKELEEDYPIKIKEKETLEGEKYLLTASPAVLNYEIFINLDFSFREKVQQPEKTIIKTNFPVLFTEYVYHLSMDEILAEKIRAIYTREKGRDVYDLWFLLNKGAKIDIDIINKKLNYDNGGEFNKTELVKKVKKLDKKEFVKDLQPFVIYKQRDSLGQLYDYVIDYISQNL